MRSIALLSTAGMSLAWALETQAQTDFSECLARLERTALDSGIRPGTVESILATVEPR